jgi:RNA polymerase sigma-70 factor, ECF subfamily
MNSGRNKYDSEPDEKLLKEYSLTGDIDILAGLFSKYTYLIYGVCLKYLKNRDDSKDAVMHIFEKLITEIPCQKIENFHNWLYVVTKNFCLMQLRSQKSFRDKADEWLITATVFMENEQELHPLDNNDQEIDKALEDCIGRLRDEQKECIDQFYYKNLSYNEISANLHLDVKKVKSHLQNAKRNLKLCLEEKHVRE